MVRFYNRKGEVIQPSQVDGVMDIRKTFCPGHVLVSTIFSPIDLSLDMAPKPRLFETMVFSGSGNSVEQERFTDEAEALKFHAAMVEQYGGVVQEMQVPD